MLAEEENFAGLARINRELIGKAEERWMARNGWCWTWTRPRFPFTASRRTAPTRSLRVHLLSPLLLFNREGDWLAAKLRPGNVHSADDWEELLLPEIERQQKQGKEVVFRADAAFAKPEIYEALEERGVKYAIRIPANDNLERDIAELLTRPVGRPSHKPVVWYKSFLYQAASWKTARRVVAKVEFPLWGVVSARGIHCDEPGNRQPGGSAVLQQAGDSRAVDQGRQAGGEDDPAELPPVPLQRGAAVAERHGLQPG